LHHEGVDVEELQAKKKSKLTAAGAEITEVGPVVIGIGNLTQRT
jgi:hypothetical protein